MSSNVMPVAKTKSGARFQDLKAEIVALKSEINELNQRLKTSICPYCNKVRGEAHGYNREGKEVACPKFAGFSYPNAYGRYPRD